MEIDVLSTIDVVSSGLSDYLRECIIGAVFAGLKVGR
jgi:hypothetical protein